MWSFWLIVAGLFFIIEMATVGFLIFWLGIGALLAMVTSFITDNIIIQSSVFVISSGLLIFLTKPFVNKYINKKTIPTNAYALIGKKGIVTKDINNIEGVGQIKVNGETWSAKSTKENTIIKKGTEVEIEKIDGVKALVKELKISNV